MNEQNGLKILVVDDERDLCEILEYNLASEGFLVDIAYSAEQALELPIETFDLILLDVMMEQTSGYKMASIIRNELNFNVPIIFLTAKNTENDILTGFNVGADDYISKPFSIKEMLARVKAVLKRGKVLTDGSKKLISDSLVVDITNKKVQVGDKIIDLTRKEFEILVMLMQQRGHYFSRSEILNRIW